MRSTTLHSCALSPSPPFHTTLPSRSAAVAFRNVDASARALLFPAVSLHAEGGGRITILTPWGNVHASGAVTIADAATGEQMFIEWSELPGDFGGPLATFNATRGATYLVDCSVSDIPCAQAAEGDGA